MHLSCRNQDRDRARRPRLVEQGRIRQCRRPAEWWCDRHADVVVAGPIGQRDPRVRRAPPLELEGGELNEHTRMSWQRQAARSCQRGVHARQLRPSVRRGWLPGRLSRRRHSRRFEPLRLRAPTGSAWLHFMPFRSYPATLSPAPTSQKCRARGGTRTRTPFRTMDFESIASAIPPPGPMASQPIRRPERSRAMQTRRPRDGTTVETT